MPLGALEAQVVPLLVSTLPLEPGATTCNAEVPLPSKTLFAVSDVAPVPPCATVTAVAVVSTVPVASGSVKVLLADKVVGASVTRYEDEPPARPKTIIPSFVEAGAKV